MTPVGRSAVPVSLGEEGDEIASVIGFAAAAALIESLPPVGSRPWRRCLYVPAHTPVDQMVVKAIGLPIARRLSATFGGQILQPANAGRIARTRREAAVSRLRRMGRALQEIARELGLPISTVRSILVRLETAAGKQPRADRVRVKPQRKSASRADSRSKP